MQRRLNTEDSRLMYDKPTLNSEVTHTHATGDLRSEISTTALPSPSAPEPGGQVFRRRLHFQTQFVIMGSDPQGLSDTQADLVRNNHLLKNNLGNKWTRC